MSSESVIEEAAATIAVAELVASHKTWGDLLEPQKDEYRRLARTVAAVFEKAHASNVSNHPETDISPAQISVNAPTDDEREALARTIYLWDVSESVSSTTWDDLLDTQRDVWLEGADFVIAAGFRRPEYEQDRARYDAEQTTNVEIRRQSNG